MNTTDDDVKVINAIKECKTAGIRMFAIDFDMTFIDIHTHGSWSDDHELLSEHIRPLFRLLVRELLSNGLILSIVTFSPQVDLIKDLLQFCFRDHVRLGENTFVCGALPTHIGKDEHIRSVCDQYAATDKGTSLMPREVLLIDDDWFNIRTGRRSGVTSILFSTDEGAQERKLLCEIQEISQYMNIYVKK